MRNAAILTLVAALALAVGPAFAGKAKADDSDLAGSAKGGDKKGQGNDKPDPNKDKPFSEVVEGLTVSTGLFNLYHDADEGKTYIEIGKAQLDTLFICSLTRSAGDGSYYDSSAMMGEFPFVFKRVGKKVQFIHKNVYFRAGEGTAIRRAIARGVSDSIMATAKIASAPHPDRGSLLVEASGLFITDIAGTGFAFGEAKVLPNYKLDAENSYFGTLKSFADNVEIPVVLHFAAAGGPGIAPTLPDKRSFQHTLHYSLSSLPKTDFRPRIADDRVGHFLTIYQDYTSVLTDTPYVRYVNRWDLRKAEPRMPLSPPLKPIVYWLENTIPVEHRDAVRAGVLMWNRAFEAIGIKDAIVVKVQEDDADWDPADTRYSTIRWMFNPGAGYAVGPSRTNPFTGEIYDADIRISADFVRYVMFGYEQLVDPVTASMDGPAGSEQIPRWMQSGKNCNHAEGLAREAAFAASVLTARGQIDPLSPAGAKYIHDYVVDLVAHEVGHTLGLRHNFKASTIHSTGELGDPAVTGKDGVTGSVMDYTPVNLAAPGKPQGDFFHTTVGPYDLWAIEYAYRPIDAASSEGELGELARIASRVAEGSLPYGTDEDAWGGPAGMDPSATRWDLGADSIGYYRDRVTIATELFNKMESHFGTEGERYQKMRTVFGRGFGQIAGSVTNVCKYIGGVYHRRDHVGDAGGRLPFAPVPAARQREALGFLSQHIFGPTAFTFSPELLQKLAPERLTDFEGSTWNEGRLDYPLHDQVLAVHRRALDHLYHPMLLSRVADNALRFAPGDAFEMPALFTELRGAVWAELASGANTTSMRRGLQRAHLGKLLEMVVEPPGGLTADASALARADLRWLEAELERAVTRPNLDAGSRAHFDESRALIEAALEAGLERKLKGM